MRCLYCLGENLPNPVIKEPEIKSYVVTIYNRNSSSDEVVRRIMKAFNAEDAIVQAKLFYEKPLINFPCIDNWEVGKIEPYSTICECGHEKSGHQPNGMPGGGYKCYVLDDKGGSCPCPRDPNEL